MNSQRMRISTGVGELDPLLGGLLIGDNVVWYDDAGSLAAVFSLNFLQAAETQQKPFIYWGDREVSVGNGRGKRATRLPDFSWKKTERPGRPINPGRRPP